MERTTLLLDDGERTRPPCWRVTRGASGRSGEVVALIFPLLFEAMGQWTSQGRVMVKAIFWLQCELCFNFGSCCAQFLNCLSYIGTLIYIR
jgi:hypothetical protein